MSHKHHSAQTAYARTIRVYFLLFWQVVYRADGVNLDVISLAQRRVFFEARGAPSFGLCAVDATTPLLPVTFTSEQAVVELSPWLPTASGSRNLRFQMTTVEPTALLMYSFGPPGTTDFFGIEMIEGEWETSFRIL